MAAGDVDRPVPHACAVCGLVLNYRTSAFSADVAFWEHSTPADHPVVAVPAEQLRANFRCDFCMADNAAWKLPVEPHEIAPGHMDAGDWAACDDCAELIRAGRWSKLAVRAAAASGDGSRSDLELFEALYAQLRTHISGPLARR